MTTNASSSALPNPLKPYSDTQIAYLSARGIPEEVARSLNIINAATEADLPVGSASYWTRDSGYLPGLIFPWVSPDGDVVPQLHPDVPVLVVDPDTGEVDEKKYVFAAGAKAPLWQLKKAANDDPRVTVVIEGTCQSIKGAMHAADDVAVYGVAGCWNWSSNGLATADLKVVDGTDTVIIFDGDVTTNSMVRSALIYLMDECVVENASSVRWKAAARPVRDRHPGLDDVLTGKPGREAIILANLIETAAVKKPANVSAREETKREAKKARELARKHEEVIDKNTGRPRLDVSGDKHELANDIVSTLRRWDEDNLFSVGQRLTRRQADKLTRLDKDHLADILGYLCRPGMENAKTGEWIDAWPDGQTQAAALLRADQTFAPLEQVVKAPFIREDGTVCQENGYDADSQTFLRMEPGLAGEIEVPDEPTASEVQMAVKLLLDDWLVDFPFPTQADRANALAFVLTPFIRSWNSINTVPMCVINGNGPSAGKGYFVDVFSRVVVGHAFTPIAMPDGDDEMRKAITSSLLAGRQLMMWDETHVVQGRFLAQLLTGDNWEDRKLGVSEMVALPNRTITAALGNNVRVEADCARRFYPVRIAPDMENPENRPTSSFRHPDIKGWTTENRARLLNAILTLIRSWHVNGRTPGKDDLGSFDKWQRTVGGILINAGVPGFLDGLKEIRQTVNSTGEDFEVHLGWLARDFGVEKPFKCSEVARRMIRAGADAHLPGPRNLNLPDPSASYAQILGKFYRSKLGQWSNSLGIEPCGVRDGYQHWHVIRKPEAIDLSVDPMPNPDDDDNDGQVGPLVHYSDSEDKAGQVGPLGTTTGQTGSDGQIGDLVHYSDSDDIPDGSDDSDTGNGPVDSIGVILPEGYEPDEYDYADVADGDEVEGVTEGQIGDLVHYSDSKDTMAENGANQDPLGRLSVGVVGSSGGVLPKDPSGKNSTYADDHERPRVFYTEAPSGEVPPLLPLLPLTAEEASQGVAVTPEYERIDLREFRMPATYPLKEGVINFDLEGDDVNRLFLKEPDFLTIGGIQAGSEITVTDDLAALTQQVRKAKLAMGHNILGFDLIALALHHGLDIEEMAEREALWDTLLTAVLNDPPQARDSDHIDKNYGLDAQVRRHVDPNRGKVGDLKALAMKHGGSRKAFGSIPADDAEYVTYCAADVDIDTQLAKTQKRTPYVIREHKAGAIAAGMRIRGFRVDVELLQERVQAGRKRKAELTTRLVRDYGLPTVGADGKQSKAPQSTKAGKEAIRRAFDDLGVELGTTSGGSPALSKEAMQEFLGVTDNNGIETSPPHEEERVRDLAETVQSLNGIRTVYETMERCRVGDRVHPNITMYQASGRWSFSEPGLTVMGKNGTKVAEREVLLPDNDQEVLVSFDLDQIDARMVAAHSQDEAYLENFGPGKDLHHENAVAVWGEMEPGPDGKHPMRDFYAKRLGHSWNYNVGIPKLGVMCGSDEVAREFDAAMRERYPDLVAWRRRVVRWGEAGLLLENGWGRQLRVDPRRSYTQAPALICQSAAMDALKEGLLRLPKWVRAMVKAVIHDEIVLSIPLDKLEEAKAIVVAAMTFTWKPTMAEEEFINTVQIKAGASKPGTTWAGCYAK